ALRSHVASSSRGVQELGVDLPSNRLPMPRHLQSSTDGHQKTGTSVLSAVLQIHSVEARCATSVRLLLASQARRARSISQCPRTRFWKPLSRSSSDILRALRSPFGMSIALSLHASAPSRHSGVFPWKDI